MKKLFTITLLVTIVLKIQSCRTNEQLIQHQCRCKQGYIKYKGRCVLCPENSKYNFRLKTCRCTKGFLFDRQSNSCLNVCGINQFFNGFECKCKSKFRLIYGNCGKCPQNSWYDKFGQDCICLQNYVWNNGYCFHKNHPKSYDKFIPKNYDYYVVDYNNSDEQEQEDQLYILQSNNKKLFYNHQYEKTIDLENKAHYQKQFQEDYFIDNEESQFFEDYLVQDEAQFQEKNQQLKLKQDNILDIGNVYKRQFTKISEQDSFKCSQNNNLSSEATSYQCNQSQIIGFKCVSKCLQNEQMNQKGKCYCKHGYIRYQDRLCLKQCEKESWWDSKIGKCHYN